MPRVHRPRGWQRRSFIFYANAKGGLLHVSALYRKWRPKTFSQVVGQDHITGTLQRQVAEGRTAHAYLFTGTRGTGKTTCARILAKAVNCLHPEDGAPATGARPAGASTAAPCWT